VRITIDGQSIRAVDLQSARGRDVIALQQATGWGLDELVAMSDDKKNHALMNKVLEFLSERNRGKFVTWDEVLDRPLAFVEPDPGDPGVRDQGDGPGEAEDPTSASTASPSVDAVAVPSAPVVTRASPSSTATSDGSTTRSTPDSSTS
jgi:hypothetical protein